ncbi:MAG: oxidoreductase [Planctomycetes bacterium]|nr:oxidoreductase [Planctomycetota bacterium]MDP6409640.1 SDR family NAD(P)-dependent oxidoreductase [Planctomycetota bacterium]
MQTLKDTVAVVTGGSSGIGLATAKALAAGGAAVALVGRNAERLAGALDAVRAEVREARLEALSFDVRAAADMEALVERVLASWGRIDILVAAAGSAGNSAATRGLPHAVADLPLAEWDEVIDTNLKGVFHGLRAVLPAMIEQGAGEIVCVSSARGALVGLPYNAAYSASKHGLRGLCSCLAEEVASRGIRVQSVLPDVTDTPMMHATRSMAPDGLLDPRQVAETILRLILAPDDALLVDPLLAPFPAPGAQP